MADDSEASKFFISPAQTTGGPHPEIATNGDLNGLDDEKDVDQEDDFSYGPGGGEDCDFDDDDFDSDLVDAP